jgi:hypothetical protein
VEAEEYRRFEKNLLQVNGSVSAFVAQHRQAEIDPSSSVRAGSVRQAAVECAARCGRNIQARSTRTGRKNPQHGAGKMNNSVVRCMYATVRVVAAQAV